MDKIKLLYYGDAPCVDTGFGRVSREILTRLQSTGKYDIYTLGINYYGDPHSLEGKLKIWPVREHDPYGSNRLAGMLMDVKPDVFFVLNDYDVLHFLPQVYDIACHRLKKEIAFCWYFPVDGSPVYQEYIDVFKRFVDYPVVYTEYGQKELLKTDPSFNVPFIYHGVDTDLFKPLSEERKKELKNQFKIGDDKFVVFSIGVNQIRKQYNILLEAFKYFSEGKENDVHLYIHTMPYTGYGWDIHRLVRYFDLEKSVSYTKNIYGPIGVPDENMNYIYNAADIAVFPHIGEGFGFCQLEAMAAGVPTITHGVTSTPELVKDGAVQIPTAKIRKPKSDDFMDLEYFFPCGDRSLKRPIPDIYEIVDSMQKLFENKDLRDDMSRRGRERVLSENRFNWSYVANKFDEVFDKAYKSTNSLDLELAEIL